ncbi:MAG: hypothetical protein COX17_07310 [Deltaproteobacteria bacterium CG23_combo_of_CG06-09_8_20_14_all_60_8]|nr:MAG: hypothetical protein AUK28_06535 [Desulfobacterales bacterium CG2_30_60_27]PIP43385.1 MAG: hypothetical protein COX17_07310 [Deltaproteobacteria bacterium CG23_combo_of_CG06-09_8_20_14_all_60_8]
MTDLSHHFIYGACTDYLTGASLVDTDDERYRQKLARLLVEEKGYDRAELTARQTIETQFAGQFTVSRIDLVVSCQDRRFMVVRYGPGSLVTRERPAIAAARVLEANYQMPLAVVTNGEDAELLDTATGQVLGTGLAAIPSRAEAVALLPALHFLPPLPDARRERELRILNVFDVEVCCGDTCGLKAERES